MCSFHPAPACLVQASSAIALAHAASLPGNRSTLVRYSAWYRLVSPHLAVQTWLLGVGEASLIPPPPHSTRLKSAFLSILALISARLLH